MNVLETERLVLRPLEMSDVDALEVLHADPEVMRYLDRSAPARNYVTDGFFAAIEKSTGSFLGWFEFRPIAPGEVELGYRLHPTCWGRGFATEGGKALIEHGFTERGVQRVMAATMTVNAGSRRVMEKCGLTFVRTFFQDWPDPLPGSDLGEVEYELTKEQWRSR